MPEAIEATKQTIGTSVGGEHLAIFSRAVLNSLETGLAEETFAQIIDGVPIARVVRDTRADTLPKGHPVHEKHKELCPGALEKAREFRQRFDPGTLQFDAAVSTFHPLSLHPMPPSDCSIREAPK